jgi:hypothetical protein
MTSGKEKRSSPECHLSPGLSPDHDGLIPEALRSGKITVAAMLPDGIFAGKAITPFWLRSLTTWGY